MNRRWTICALILMALASPARGGAPTRAPAEWSHASQGTMISPGREARAVPVPVSRVLTRAESGGGAPPPTTVLPRALSGEISPLPRRAALLAESTRPIPEGRLVMAVEGDEILIQTRDTTVVTRLEVIGRTHKADTAAEVRIGKAAFLAFQLTQRQWFVPQALVANLESEQVGIRKGDEVTYFKSADLDRVPDPDTFSTEKQPIRRWLFALR